MESETKAGARIAYDCTGCGERKDETQGTPCEGCGAGVCYRCVRKDNRCRKCGSCVLCGADLARGEAHDGAVHQSEAVHQFFKSGGATGDEGRKAVACVCSLSPPAEARQLVGVDQYVCATHKGRGVFTVAGVWSPTCCGACVEGGRG